MKNIAIICDNMKQVEAVCKKNNFQFEDFCLISMKIWINEGSQIVIFPTKKEWEVMDENLYFENFKLKQ